MLRTLVSSAAALTVALLSARASASYQTWAEVPPAPGAVGYCAWPQLSSATTQSVNPAGFAVFNGTITATSCYAETADFGGLRDMLIEQGSRVTPFAMLGAMSGRWAWGASVSVTNVGHVFTARGDGSLWFFNGGWSQVQAPSQYWMTNVAAASDAIVYGLSPNNCTATDGDCVIESINGGVTFYPYGSSPGAVSIAYDPVIGNLWTVSRMGRIYKSSLACSMWGTHKSCVPTYTEVGELGLPVSGSAYGTMKIAAFNGVPYVIAITNNAYGGNVYTLVGGVWRQMGTITDAADIAVDRVGGSVYVTRWQGGSTTVTFDNIYEWVTIPS